MDTVPHASVLLHSYLGDCGFAAIATLASAAAITYVLLCTALRDRQRLAMERRLGFGSRRLLSTMTLNEAHLVQNWLSAQEFPKVCSAAVFFALFKTYGIPSISRLLVSTGHFTHGLKAASRRAADTSVLICEMVVAPPASERAASATARINYLHRPHRRAGRISDQDMLYTLSLFALEGIRWIDKYEWRRLTDLERCAMAVFWKAKGEDLGVSYDLLPSHERGWPDGLAWLEELDAWSRRYEAEHMAPSDDNALLADASMEMVLFKMPGRVKGVGRSLASVLLGQNLRDAMRIPHPPRRYEMILSFVVGVRKFLIRHLCVPRPYRRRHQRIDETPDSLTGRYHVKHWRVYPWYAQVPITKPTCAWLRAPPMSDGTDLIPEGYLISEVGPPEQVGMGEAEMRKTKELLMMQDPGRCPFAPRDSTSVQGG